MSPHILPVTSAHGDGFAPLPFCRLVSCLGTSLAELQADFARRGFSVRPDQSIHDPDSILFMSQVVGAGSWVLTLLQHGLSCDWAAGSPPPYMEPNNRSALDNLDSLRSTVSTWEQAGFVTRLGQPAWCCNPMTVAVQFNPVTGVTKFRPCIDLSRHVNRYIAASSVQLDHLSISQELILPGDFMTSLDLENQFFHVRLAPAMRKYLGFAVLATDGSMQYFQYQVMAYGVKPAVTVVTRLLRPIKAYMHTLGIRFSIYVDDGRVAASSAQLCSEQTNFLLLVLQLAGWKIQWKKTVLTPSTSLLHLGFITDSVAMRYFITPEKWNGVRLSLSALLDAAAAGRSAPAKEVAAVLGRLNSLHRSHGSVVRVLSRALQHQLGLVVAQEGWSGSFRLSSASKSELELLLRWLPSFHGRAIPTAQAASHILSLRQVAAAQAAVTAAEAVCEADDNYRRSYVLHADGTLAISADFILDVQAASGCLTELLGLSRFLDSDGAALAAAGTRFLFWPTSLEASAKFVTSGSRNPAVQRVVFTIKRRESLTCLTVIPVWSPRSTSRLSLLSSKTSFSRNTDEWSVDRPHLAAVFKALGFFPRVDCFAIPANSISTAFFSAGPQLGAAGVDFFAQEPTARASLFLCPPVSLVARALDKFLSFPESTAVLLFPRWPAAVFWPVLFPGGSPHQAAVRVHYFTPSFFSVLPIPSLFTSGARIPMVAFLLKS